MITSVHENSTISSTQFGVRHWVQKILFFKAVFVALVVVGFAYLTPPNTAHAQGITKWHCYLQNEYAGSVNIWWGHRVGDARWACNEWLSRCGNGGGCAARLDAKSVTKWNCYRQRKYAGSVNIWWGHRTRDAIWACNEWIPRCGNGGGCTARFVRTVPQREQLKQQPKQQSTVNELAEDVVQILTPKGCATGISDRAMKEAMDAVGIVDEITGVEVSRLARLLLEGICHPCSPVDRHGRPNLKCL